MKKMSFLLVLIGLFFYFGWSHLTSPKGDQKVDYLPAKKECFHESKFHYCIFKSEQGVNGDIAYYLHGRNLDENSWNDDTYYTAMIQKYWADHKIIPPTIVSISYGNTWLLSPQRSSLESGLLEDFKNKINEIEIKLGPPRKRLLFGESMGGVNSLIAGLTYENFFDKVAAFCPAIYKESPFSSLTAFNHFLERTGANPKIIFGVVQLAKKYISNDEEWSKIDPLKLIKNNKSKNLKLYLSCGLYDIYGNFEGSNLFAETAQLKKIDIEWHPLYGGHCVIDIPSAAEFLIAAEKGKNNL